MANDDTNEIPFYAGGKVRKVGVELTHPNDPQMARHAYLSAVVARDHGVSDLLPDQIEIRMAGILATGEPLQALQLRTLRFARDMLDATIKNLEQSR